MIHQIYHKEFYYNNVYITKKCNSLKTPVVDVVEECFDNTVDLFWLLLMMSVTHKAFDNCRLVNQDFK